MDIIYALREERDTGVHSAERIDKYTLALGQLEKENTALKVQVIKYEEGKEA